MSEIDEDMFLRASKSLRKFRRQCPGLTTVARACTGSSTVRVQPGANPCTDGKTIWLRPPIELGDDVTHDRHLCGVRDEQTLVMLCEACKVDDHTLATAFHEIGHIAKESFGDGDSRVKVWRDRAKKSGIDATKVQYAEAKGGYLALAGLVDPHLPWAFNAYEDVRVNALVADERPGFRKMNRAQKHEIVSKGTDDGQGGRVHWRDQPPHAQAGIMAYAMADGDVDLWRPNLDEELGDLVFDDEIIIKLSDKVKYADDTFEVMELAEKLVKRFRELNILPEPEEDPGEGGEGDAGESGAGDAGESGAGDGDESGEGDGDESGEGDGDESDEGDGGESGEGDGDESDGSASGDNPMDEDFAREVEKALNGASGHPDGVPDADALNSNTISAGGVGGSGDNDVFEIAIQQGHHFDAPTTELSTVTFRDIDVTDDRLSISTSDAASRAQSNGVLELEPGVVGPGVSRLRKIFDANKASGMERNLRRGRVSKRALGRRYAVGDDRLFQKKRLPEKRSYHIVVMMDMSGSTVSDTFDNMKQWKKFRGDQSRNRKADTFTYPSTGDSMRVYDAEKHLAVHLGEMFDRLGVSFEMYGHSSHIDGVTIGEHYMGSFDMFKVKGPGDVWGREAKHRLASLQGASGNVDGHAVEFARKRADESDATTKIIVYMSDGEMPAVNYDEELLILRSECARIKASRDTHMVGIGIHCDAPSEHGLETVVVNEAKDLQVAIQFMEKLLS